MTKENIKEKRLYFLFSKLKDKKSNKTHFSLIIDTLINEKNSFLNLYEISQKLGDIGINIKAEALLLITQNENYKGYFDLPENFKIDTPFKLRKIHYDTFSSYTNYYDKLEDYIINFLQKNAISKNKSTIVKEILLTTLFNRNLTFLKQLISSKDANDLENILILDKNGKFKPDDCGIYNNMILTSGEVLNEIIKVLLYKIFDFLQLHYNPNIDKTLNETYKNKVFYLDSSFIIRLFGFDNELRENRALELLNILKNIEGVKFLIHNSTIKETQINIEILINKVFKLLNHSEKSLLKVNEISNKKNDTIELYLRLKQKKKITGRDDFMLYFKNIVLKLKSIIGNIHIERDDKKIKYSQEKVDDISTALAVTDKTNSRITHISKVLLYLDGLRESNNYNLYDIKYWLITTDNTTLKIDAQLRILSEDNSKSVCILPTELLRTISNRTEIAADYVEVFKKFMIYSNTYEEQYSDEELETIDKVITLAESANTEEYDVDYYISNLFDEINLEELVNRLNKIEEDEKKDSELIEIFEKTFSGNYKEKYLELFAKKENSKRIFSKIMRYVIIFSIPTLVLIVFLKYVLNPDFTFSDPLTYVNDGNWSKLEFIFTIIQIVLIPSCIYINKKYGIKVEHWFNRK